MKLYRMSSIQFSWNSLVTAVIGTILITMVFVSCQQPSGNNASNTSRENLKERVLRMGKIRAGYAIYPPASIKDPNTGKISGIIVDVLNEAAKNLGLEVEWNEEVAFGTMIEGLQNNRYDIIGSGVWANAARAKQADFVVPLYYNAVGVYVRANDDRFKKGMADFYSMNQKDLKISTIDGEMSALIAQTDFPDAKTVGLPQLSEGTQLLLEVATRKADVTFVQPFTADQYLAANPGSIRNIAKDKPIRVFPACFMIKDGEYEFRRMLDVTVDELINSGFVDRAINKYAPNDESLTRIAYPYRTGEK